MKLSWAWWTTAIIATFLVVPAVYYSSDRVEAGLIVSAWLWGLCCIGVYDLKVLQRG
jgi:hypothetical protein